jgi:hypothetical protein
MTVQQQQKRASAARWEVDNPVLADGEIGVVSPTGRMKVGDGLTAWNDLPYSAPAVDAVQIAVAEAAEIYVTQQAAGAYLSLSGANAQYLPAAVTEPLPLLTVETVGRAPIADRENYINATYTWQTFGTTGATASVTGRLRGRGNSSWELSPKKSFRVKTDTDFQFWQAIQPSKEWVFLATPFDPSMLRNDLFYEIARRVGGMDFVPYFDMAEIVVNGEYFGVYMIGQNVEISEGRVPGPRVSGTTGLGLTGTYLLEGAAQADAEDVFFLTPRGLRIVFDQPSGSNATQAAYITDWISDFEDVLFDDDVWLDPVNGYRSKVSMPSFIGWWFANEITYNYDSIFGFVGDTLNGNSIKMYKTRDTATELGKLHLGPAWDGDSTLGLNVPAAINRPYQLAFPESPSEWQTRQGLWLTRMCQDLEFYSLARETFYSLYDNLTDSGTDIEQWLYARGRKIAAARARNHVLWSDSIPSISNSAWRTEVRQMVEWQQARLEWIKVQFDSGFPISLPGAVG